MCELVEGIVTVPQHGGFVPSTALVIDDSIPPLFGYQPYGAGRPGETEGYVPYGRGQSGRD